jgi:MFS family permease
MVLLLAVLPAAVLTVLAYWQHGVSILHVTPSDPDDFRNWLVVRNFHDVGFASGYFVHNEVPAWWSLTPFAADGPWSAMLFGTLALIGGWQPYSWVVYNLVLFSVALSLYGVFSRTSGRGLAWVAIFVSLIPVVCLGALSSSYSHFYVTLGVALAILFGEMFYRREQGRRLGWLRAGCVSTVFVASIYKVDWAVLLFPALLMGKNGVRAWLGWGGLAFVLCLMSAVVMFVAGAPIGSPSSTLSFWNSENPLLAAVRMVLKLVPENVNSYFSGKLTARELLVQLVGLVILAGFAVPGLWKKGLAPGLRKELLWFNVFNVASVFILVNTLYVPYAGVGEKFLTAHWLSSVLAQLRYFSRRTLVLLTGLGILMFLLFLGRFCSNTLAYFSALPEARARQFATVARETLKYTPGADRWCNTVLNLTGDYPPEILALPAGLGYSVVMVPDRVSLPLKSRYVIDNGSPATAKIVSASRLYPLLRTRFGTIYENLDAPCPRKNVP